MRNIRSLCPCCRVYFLGCLQPLYLLVGCLQLMTPVYQSDCRKYLGCSKAASNTWQLAEGKCFTHPSCVPIQRLHISNACQKLLWMHPSEGSWKCSLQMCLCFLTPLLFQSKKSKRSFPNYSKADLDPKPFKASWVVEMSGSFPWLLDLQFATFRRGCFAKNVPQKAWRAFLEHYLKNLQEIIPKRV